MTASALRQGCPPALSPHAIRFLTTASGSSCVRCQTTGLNDSGQGHRETPGKGLFVRRTGEAAVREQGELAGRVLLDILRSKETDQDVVVPTQLVIRDSTAPPHS